MLKLKKKELEQLISTLEWVIVSTMSTQEVRQQLINVQDKLKNILKSVPDANGFSIKVINDEKIDSF